MWSIYDGDRAAIYPIITIQKHDHFQICHVFEELGPKS